MAKIPHLELVSFDICPYVQRSVITLLHKKVDFKITYIDLQSPPEWFPKRSPLGKVPLLFVREAEGSEPVTLFESAVINEFVDEITPPALTPREPLRRAFERAWIEVGSELLGSLFSITMAGSDEDRKEARDELWSTMDRLEDILPGGKTFRGSEFSLVDSAYAPLFTRLQMFKPMVQDPHWQSKLPKTRRWAESLVELREVRESVIPEFKQKFASYLKLRGNPWAEQIV